MKLTILTTSAESSFNSSWGMLIFAIVIILGVLTVYTFNDAPKNNMNSGAWAFIVFFTGGIPGFIIYLIAREYVKYQDEQFLTLAKILKEKQK